MDRDKISDMRFASKRAFSRYAGQIRTHFAPVHGTDRTKVLDIYFATRKAILSSRLVLKSELIFPSYSISFLNGLFLE